ncbi:MAG TPA: hypothetical protein VK646_02765 [Actinomycetota bacterium]|nr:hypothetical protein [Actinomycetota bacterium]
MEHPERAPLVEIVPALSNVAWAPDIVVQSIEPLFVYLGPDGPRHLRPIHAPSLRLGMRPDQQPGTVVVQAAARYGLTPLLVHSTSWRFDAGRVVLTYVAAVAPPGPEPNENLADEPVERAALARGDAFAPPPTIDVAQVLEHAFRHLAWLVKDDAEVRAALPDWVTFLSAYEPEPFRAFGAPPG